jgi:hypothetical protein
VNEDEQHQREYEGSSRSRKNAKAANSLSFNMKRVRAQRCCNAAPGMAAAGDII